MKGFTHESSDAMNQIEWYTPKWIFEAMDTKFDMDVCHPINTIPYIPASKKYTIKDDGLNQPWIGKVWMNPPYGKSIDKWLEKFYNHQNGIALVFARTDTQWFHKYCATADAILFLSGRIKFVDGLGKKSGSPGCGSMLVAFGKENVKTLESMYEYGLIIYP